MDIEHSYISVQPRPTGMSHLFFSFPLTSFFALNYFFISIFLLSSCCMFVVRVVERECVRAESEYGCVLCACEQVVLLYSTVAVATY